MDCLRIDQFEDDIGFIGWCLGQEGYQHNLEENYWRKVCLKSCQKLVDSYDSFQMRYEFMWNMEIKVKSSLVVQQ